eukprot:CAMPEP_0202906302 /NCGR_PEP_ID=MMETSP1392-20130828/38231_1 /ASSEMBLY_ACC=CAM_ASM_000868 /TAXON_ID=225041 /ORGANISM="Chlamydomonas chlamydogama, Strain SAG 11-48b" /LENGTH=1035 /DNA_ID=CAMNT_0049594745 /DNA_START=120 /DNA_END=3227 /DNA_ORIENTATION=+
MMRLPGLIILMRLPGLIVPLHFKQEQDGNDYDSTHESSSGGMEDQQEEEADPPCDREAEANALRQERREANIKALLANNLQTHRQPVMSRYLSLQESERVLKRPFFSPKPGAPAVSDALKRKLVARRRFIPWGDNKPFLVPSLPLPPRIVESANMPAPTPVQDLCSGEVLPAGVEPLVLWEPPEGAAGQGVVVDNMLLKFLRPHQREGVQFMFECVAGLRLVEGRGCILADDMGLGKTLQGITLLWSLVQHGHELLGGTPLVQRAIIVCPTSLVSNWENECAKWLKGRLTTMALCESARDDVIFAINQFLHPANPYKVLIISYETFRMHAARFQGAGACDLLICDEAHRLKNDTTLTNKALDSLLCRRRVLLSGTPLQNHLDEFYAMVDFCNPGVLGTTAEFRRTYESPILAGREPGASDEEVELGNERSMQLSALVNNFILRRTNALLSQHLPPKVVEVVCCRLTPLQQALYCHFLESKAARKLLSGRGTTGVLSAITSLKKLCNHPKLIYDAVHSNAKIDKGAGDDALSDGFQNLGDLFPVGLFDNGRVGRGGMAVGWELMSGKMAVLARMLNLLHAETKDRIVIVSNYTQTLDLIGQLCRERSYPFLRLDGSTSISKRQKLVKVFNDPHERQFVFLLSSKAGGCGLNLIGGNRLVLFDPDWNPANDKQAAARVWRDGQTKRVFVYRFLSTGTIEEKVFQRQLSKEGLQSLVSKNGKAAANLLSAEELRELFTLDPETLSNTYDMMCPGGSAAAGGGAAHVAAGAQCDGTGEQPAAEAADATVAAARGALGEKPQVHKLQVGAPTEEDLKNWGHHSSAATLPDAVMMRVADPEVSFIFTCEVDGKPVEEEEPGPRAGARQQQQQQHRGRPAQAAPAVSAGLVKTSDPGRCPAPRPQQPSNTPLLKENLDPGDSRQVLGAAGGSQLAHAGPQHCASAVRTTAAAASSSCKLMGAHALDAPAALAQLPSAGLPPALAQVYAAAPPLQQLQANSSVSRLSLSKRPQCAPATGNALKRPAAGPAVIEGTDDEDDAFN